MASLNEFKINSLIFILGTAHKFQLTSQDLKFYLLDLCRKLNVGGIAEEMSEEALDEKGCAESIPMQVAVTLRIKHQLCDPNSAEREKLEILQENQILLLNWKKGMNLSDAEIHMRIIENYSKREKYWLNQLRLLNSWPVLFVCGSSHVNSFHQLLGEQKIASSIIENDWDPS
jgi:hypothetical protein